MPDYYCVNAAILHHAPSTSPVQILTCPHYFDVVFCFSPFLPLIKAIEKSGVLAAWAATAWAKKLGKRTTRAGLNDFQRFQVKSHKQKRSRIVRSEFRKLKKSA